MTFQTAIERACTVVGGQSELARRLAALKKRKLSSQAVNRWVRHGQVPSFWALAVEEACEARVTRYDLRPDFYPRVRGGG